MHRLKRKLFFINIWHDIKASITVFFVALPLCLGISVASGAPVYAGLVAGIIGGMIVPLISRSTLSVSGPAAGLTAISALAILQLGEIGIFFVSVALAGVLQVLLGIFRLGGFTHLIPSSVIKGMLAAIGIMLIGKQVPLIVGYDNPDFFLNIFTFQQHINELQKQVSPGAILVTCVSLLFLILWEKKIASRVRFVPVSFITVAVGSLFTYAMGIYFPSLGLKASQFVIIPDEDLVLKLPQLSALFTQWEVWKTSVTICVVASLETLLSIEAIDKIDPLNRVTPQNREMIAQGVGNLASGMVGGIPITSVIVRSAANTEAGARTRFSAFLHGVWLLLTVMFAGPVVNYIPYCVLAVILIRTGYALTRPSVILGVYHQGREQFLPFILTIISILCTNLLIGVLIGIGFAIYFLIKHTYRAGYTITEKTEGHIRHITIELALNVSFLNKRRFLELLEKIPAYSIVEIDGEHSVYIDHDVLEVFHTFKVKAAARHIQFIMRGIPDAVVVDTHG